MPPKASRATAVVHDDTESTKPAAAEKKNGHGLTNGKMKRVASQNGSNLKDVQNAANIPSPSVEPSTSAPATNPTVSSCLCRAQQSLDIGPKHTDKTFCTNNMSATCTDPMGHIRP